MYPHQIRLAHPPKRDPALVGDDYHGYAGAIEQSYALGGAAEQLQLLGSRYVVSLGRLDVDGPVAIKEDSVQRPGHNLELQHPKAEQRLLDNLADDVGAEHVSLLNAGRRR